MAHLKRLMASKHFAIERKTKKYTVAPSPGPHAKDGCIPLQIVLRDVLGVASNASEVKKILNEGNVHVDGKIVKNPKFPVGMMDVIEIPKTKNAYRVIPIDGKLSLNKIDEVQAKFKLCKITNKTTIKGGKFQLNMHDGRNMLVSEADAKKYAVGDTIKIALPNQKIMGHFALKIGNMGMIETGKSAGTVGKVKDIILVKGRENNKAVLDVNGSDVRTIKDYIFVIGENTPEIVLEKR